MNKFSLVIFLLLINLTIFANDIRIKIYQKEDIVNVKLKLKQVMLQGDMETENYMTNPDLISNITIVVDGKTVYNISTSPFISRDPSFKFSFRGKIKNNQASIFITYNDGRQTKGHIKLQKLKYKSIGGQLLWSQMEPTKYTLPKNSRTINNKGWREKRPELAIKELYGLISVAKNEITIKAPKYSENSGNIPILIQSKINLESIAIFDNANPYSTIAILDIPINAIINYNIRVNIQPRCDRYNILTIIGKGKDGKYYKATHNFKRLLTGSHSTCIETSEIPLTEKEKEVINKITKARLKETEDNCLNGDATQCFILGDAYHFGKDRNGLICEQNDMKSQKFYKAGADLYTKACNNNNFKKCESLAYSYKQGRGRKTDKDKAIMYFKKACNEGKDPWSCESLAQMYSDKDENSIQAYIQSCNFGAGRSCMRVARFFETGTYSLLESDKKSNNSINIEKAKLFYQKGCDNGMSCKDVARLYLKDNNQVSKEKALKALTKACYRGDKRACFKVGKIYEKGNSVIKNITRSKEFYQKSCSGYTQEACDKLGKPPMSFFPESDKDIKNNIGFTEQCKNNDYWACYRLGDIYQKGKGVKKDIKLAKQYYTKSCNGLYYESCFNLAHIYQHEKNYNQAVPLYSKVCKNDSYYGCRSLGRVYLEKEAGYQNLPLALEFYQKACDKGDTVACIVEVKRLKNMINKR